MTDHPTPAPGGTLCIACGYPRSAHSVRWPNANFMTPPCDVYRPPAPVSPVVPAGETRCECGTEFEAYLCPACMAEYPAPSPVVPAGETFHSLDEFDRRYFPDSVGEPVPKPPSLPAPVSPEAPPLSEEEQRAILTDATRAMFQRGELTVEDVFDVFAGHEVGAAREIASLEARLTETSQRLAAYDDAYPHLVRLGQDATEEAARLREALSKIEEEATRESSARTCNYERGPYRALIAIHDRARAALSERPQGETP